MWIVGLLLLYVQIAWVVLVKYSIGKYSTEWASAGGAWAMVAGSE